MSATCSGCGDCCAAITLSAAMVSAASTAVDRGSTSPDILWYRDDLRPLTFEEALARRPSLSPQRDGTAFFECRHFDYAARRCRDHESRPPVCRGFPWYGRVPEAWGLADLPRCSHWSDVPFWTADAQGLAAVNEAAVLA